MDDTLNPNKVDKIYGSLFKACKDQDSLREAFEFNRSLSLTQINFLFDNNISFIKEST